MAGIGCAGGHQPIENLADLVDLADRDGDLIGHAEAGKPLFDIGSGRGVDRLNGKSRGLDILLLDAGILQRRENAGHHLRIGVAGLFGGLRARVTPR